MLRLVLGLILLLLLFIAAVICVGFAIYQSSRKRIGYIPLPRRAVPAVVKALGLSADSRGRLFDLGCGDGRILGAALSSHSQLHGTGIELNPLVAWLARWRLRTLGQNRLTIIRGDIMQTNLRPATHVFAYLNPYTMKTLEPRFERELAPGTRLVSCDFPLPHRKPTRTITIGRPRQLGQTLYVYDY